LSGATALCTDTLREGGLVNKPLDRAGSAGRSAPIR
jgi:hypothetical protein